jgi:5-methylcytosine-specific restriction endonuclease McrA
MIPRYTPLKRGKPPKKRRAKPRPGRLQGDDLQALRLACWERDKSLCQHCGVRTLFDFPQEHPLAFHMAHRRGKRMWGDSLDNVHTLCGDCHRDAHRGTIGGRMFPT